MISLFDWCGCTAISDEEKREVENNIRETFEARGDMELKPCHVGQVKVQLNVEGSLLATLVGNFKCSCGKKYCKFEGISDASRMAFECFD